MQRTVADNVNREYSSLGRFLAGASKICVGSFIAMLTKVGNCTPVPYEIDVASTITPNISISSGFVGGVSSPGNIEEKLASVSGLACSVAPDIYYAATTGDWKRAGMMAGTKTVLYLGSYAIGYASRKIFRI